MNQVRVRSQQIFYYVCLNLLCSELSFEAEEQRRIMFEALKANETKTEGFQKSQDAWQGSNGAC